MKNIATTNGEGSPNTESSPMTEGAIQTTLIEYSSEGVVAKPLLFIN